jgi:hypothetical protein
MTTGIWLLIVGILGGSGTTLGIWLAVEKNKNETAEILAGQADIVQAVGEAANKAIEGQHDIQRNLTAPDLVAYACSAEGIAAAPQLCREMFCRMQQRGLDSKTGDECEEITNIINSTIILKQCGGLDDGAYQACLRIFEKRK